LFNEDSTSYEALMTMISQSAPTRIPDIYYYENSFDKFTYITKRGVKNDAGEKIGSMFIISNPKKYSSDALFPELFKQLKQGDAGNSPIYSYAIYTNKRLVSPSNKYSFATSLTEDEIPKDEFVKRTNGDFDELWYRASNEKIVVMARKRDTIIETITLFSYIFCSFLFLVAFVQFISLILKTGYNPKGLRKLLQFNIRSQVHSTIIFISVLSFLVIGVATISFFISRYNRNNSDKLSRTMKIMVNEMQKKQSDYSTFDDVIKIYDSIDNNALKKLVDEVSDIHDVDVNVYDLDGNLKVSSEPNVYRKGVLSTKMDPSAFYHLNRLRQVQHAQEERIANLSYLSIYAPVRDEDGKVYAYLNIPYFASQRELSQEISNFLVAIINLNAFIFLIAGVIALFITNRITRSFSIISDKMKEMNLGKMNEAIVWNRDDEIGELVKEYNKMVAKLGESATALAKSEREGAWREMARQVAHEIKNPLTPMKLSIQYLQKAINNDQPNVKELSGSVAKTLVEQIDHLSKIAADFSQFANIGNVSVELFDLHDVIGSLKDLYRPNPNVEIDWRPVPDKVMLRADKTQMNRLFTNLFSNAIEACVGNGICRIEVNEEQINETIKISVKDNGEGIAPEMQSKIFIPNFTTKSSGTGLGLAMCKGIVEQAKGKIWFETGEGRGTTFYVELPVEN
jgi:signal transduction histidine kinase